MYNEELQKDFKKLIKNISKEVLESTVLKKINDIKSEFHNSANELSEKLKFLEEFRTNIEEDLIEEVEKIKTDTVKVNTKLSDINKHLIKYDKNTSKQFNRSSEERKNIFKTNKKYSNNLQKHIKKNNLILSFNIILTVINTIALVLLFILIFP